MDLLSRAGGLMFENGETTQRTKESIEGLARAMGVDATVTLHWDELRIEIPKLDSVAASVTLSSPTGVHIGKVAAVTGLITAVRRGRLAADRDGLGAELSAIERMPPASTPRFASMAAAGAVALGVIFDGNDLPSLGLIALSAGVGALLRRWSGRVSANPFVQPGCAALLAGVIGAVASRLHLVTLPLLVMVCPCMVLVPGPHILNGSLDLARARMVLGAARLAFASMIVLVICMGLLAGLALGGASLPPAGASRPAPFVLDVLAAGVAVAAYGTFFSMAWRVLPVPVAIGMFAHALRWGAIALGGASPQAGALLASLIVGVIVTPVANRLDLPFAGLGFASVVSLMPGVYLFHMAGVLVEAISFGARAPEALWSGAAYDGSVAFMITLAIATGLILPKMLIERFFWKGAS